MTFKQKIISIYCFIAVLFGMYGWMFGQFKQRGLFYNLGKGLVWPVTIFPALGAVIGAVIIVAVVIAVLVFGKSRN